MVGFADDDFAADMQPPLTTVRQNGYEVGCRAAKTILARSAGDPKLRNPVRSRVPVEFIERASTGTVPAAHS